MKQWHRRRNRLCDSRRHADPTHAHEMPTCARPATDSERVVCPALQKAKPNKPKKSSPENSDDSDDDDESVVKRRPDAATLSSVGTPATSGGGEPKREKKKEKLVLKKPQVYKQWYKSYMIKVWQRERPPQT
jgi:hypothetical protein